MFLSVTVTNVFAPLTVNCENILMCYNEILKFMLCSLQPFWPLGTGIARGFLAAFDTAWMVRSWGMGVPHLKVLAERWAGFTKLISSTQCRQSHFIFTSWAVSCETRWSSWCNYFLFPHYLPYFSPPDCLLIQWNGALFRKGKWYHLIYQTRREKQSSTVSMIFGFRKTKIRI